MPFLPVLVGGAGERLHVVAAEPGAGHRGAEHVGTFAKTPASERQFCRLCGGHIMTNHPGGGFIDVYAATIPHLAFAPAIHVHYEESVMPMKDGLPKYLASPGPDAVPLIE